MKAIGNCLAGVAVMLVTAPLLSHHNPRKRRLETVGTVNVTRDTQVEIYKTDKSRPTCLGELND